MTKIRTIEQRKRLAHRPKPYWHRLDGLRGAALGFRKHASHSLQGGGTWVLRYRVGGKYLEQAFAESDNPKMPPNGSTVLSFDQAVNRGRALYSELTSTEVLAERVKPYTVRDACRDYVNELEETGGGWKEAQQRFDAFVIPELGDCVVDKLKAEVIREWMRALAKRRPRARSAMNGRRRRYRQIDESDPDYRRRRAATVNRNWTSFRAALSLAYERERFQSPESMKVKPLKFGREPVNKAHCRPIQAEEMDGFLDALKLEDEAFQNLVMVGLYSGCRYGELGRLTVGDYDRMAGTLYVGPGKVGKDRTVSIIPEGRDLLERLTKGRDRSERLLVQPDGTPWGKSNYSRSMSRVVSRAKLEGASFKCLRDTYGSWMLSAGVRLVVVSKQLGHASVTTTEKHYVRILANLERESTAAAARIRMVGGAEIIELDAHRRVGQRQSA
jgi:integrase